MVFILLLLLSFFILKPLLLAILVGALLAYFTYPLHKKLWPKLNSETWSALLICFLVLIVFVVPLIFFVNALVKQSYAIFQIAKQNFSSGFFSGCEGVTCLLREFTSNPAVIEFVSAALKSATGWIIQKGSSFLLSVPRLVISLFIVFFTTFYFLKDGKQLFLKVSTYLSMKKKHYAVIIQRLEEIIHAIIYGYLAIALLQGVLGALGFFIFGISSPLFWGVVMSLLALIPYLGTGIVWIPAALLLFLNGYLTESNWLMFKGVALFVYGLLIVSSVDNLLRPKLIGDKAKIHPALILLGIIGGIFLFGPLGVIIGPLVLSLTAVIITVFLDFQK